jgi:glutathione S-transferase
LQHSGDYNPDIRIGPGTVMNARSMKLLWSSRSPFVHKVMVAAHEVGVADRISTERVVVAADKPNANVMAMNPLNKIPTLLLEDGTLLYDSRVICEYLDSLHDGPKLHPSDQAFRWRVLRRQALGDGLLEIMILVWVSNAVPRRRTARATCRHIASRLRPLLIGSKLRGSDSRAHPTSAKSP